ncbi:MAG TPA: FAD-binding oxidoreductase, partial [Acidimicrobiales bacterium]|nr:FAD-binding oxidoreductase [Acidimicrobiales bacterium]
MGRRRSWWGWGYEDAALSASDAAALAALVGPRFGLDGRRRRAPSVDTLDLVSPRLVAPGSLRTFCRGDPAARASHAYGKSYRDVVRALDGRIEHPPDVVARPGNESEVVAVLDWCGDVGAAAIAYGGGSSVVGGVEPDVGDAYAGAVTIDLGALDRVLDVDAVSWAARIQAGALGPVLEDQLRPHGLTLRHFPQSFECSTLGGWIATRAGGHFATGPTHIDELVESVRVVTPAGVVETRRLPASGAGPSPDRLFLGSEGTLGIVTEAWVRVRPRPRWRAGGPVRFATFAAGVEAVRALAQSGLEPSNCRLLDPLEAAINGVGDASTAVLVVGFESAHHRLDAWADVAAQCVADHGGQVDA